MLPNLSDIQVCHDSNNARGWVYTVPISLHNFDSSQSVRSHMISSIISLSRSVCVWVCLCMFVPVPCLPIWNTPLLCFDNLSRYILYLLTSVMQPLSACNSASSGEAPLFTVCIPYCLLALAHCTRLAWKCCQAGWVWHYSKTGKALHLIKHGGYVSVCYVTFWLTQCCAPLWFSSLIIWIWSRMTYQTKYLL